MIVEPAPAKINLALHVRASRADGYHEIETLFAFLEDGDEVRAAIADAPSFVVTGPFAAATLGGYGHVASAWHQLWIQAKGVGFTIAWSALLSFAILKVLDRTVGLRVDAEQEQMGLDLAEHEERAYNLS